MSLVGTRPPTVDEWEQYELHHRSRMSTKPGITGMWQVSGRSDITDFEEVVRLDTEYIEIVTWSKKFIDLSISVCETKIDFDLQELLKDTYSKFLKTDKKTKSDLALIMQYLDENIVQETRTRNDFALWFKLMRYSDRSIDDAIKKGHQVLMRSISSVAEQICASPLMDYVRSSRNSFRWRSTMHFFFSAVVNATVSKLF